MIGRELAGRENHVQICSQTIGYTNTMGLSARPYVFCTPTAAKFGGLGNDRFVTFMAELES